MMTKLAVLVTVLLLLGLAACDRFNHAFKPQDSSDLETLLFTPLEAAFQAITLTNLEPVLDYYTEDYLHNCQYRTDRANWFLSILQQDAEVLFDVTYLQSQVMNDTLLLANWRLVAKNSFNQVIADSTFIADRIIKRNGQWLMQGNGEDCDVCNPIVNQRVIIEYFTYNTCANCPAVEAILRSLQASNPNNLTYVEYHISDPMAIPSNYNLFQYYEIPSMPVTIFQGETIILGNNPDNAVVFNQLVQNLASQPAKVGLTELQYGVTGNTLSGSVAIELRDQTIAQENLKLKYVILEKVSNIYTNYNGDPCRNVVLAAGQNALSGVTLPSTVNFSLPFSGSLPNDAYLVIWVQNIPADFNFDAAIYHGLESYIPITKRK